MSMDSELVTGTCRVLIVEDEYFLANDLERALRLEGAQIICPISELSEAIKQVEKDAFDAAMARVIFCGRLISGMAMIAPPAAEEKPLRAALGRTTAVKLLLTICTTRMLRCNVGDSYARFRTRDSRTCLPPLDCRWSTRGQR
jgi:hypothetical protein